MSASAAELRANLAAGLTAAPSGGLSDETVFHRTMIVTVARRGRFNPADRLEATDVVIHPQDGIRFQAWDSAATAYTTISAGTIGLTQTRTAELDPSIGTPSAAPVSASLGGKFSIGSSRAEAFTFSSQVESLTVSVGDSGKTLRIRRQGGTGIDLTGNTIIKVDLALSAAPDLLITFTPTNGYRSRDGMPTAPAKLALASGYHLVPPAQDDIAATASLRYTLRHIVSGDATAEERDDTVIEITREVSDAKNLILVPASEVGNSVYAIQADSGDYAGSKLKALTAGGGRPAVLCFSSYLDADGFLSWERSLPHAASQIGNVAVGFRIDSWQRLVAKYLDGLRVVRGC